jgi:hypothetical protein
MRSTIGAPIFAGIAAIAVRELRVCGEGRPASPGSSLVVEQATVTGLPRPEQLGKVDIALAPSTLAPETDLSG